jgi:hypothetical protein
VAAQQARPLRVLLTFGGHGFQEGPFFAMFDALDNVEYTKAPLPEKADLLKPGLEKQYRRDRDVRHGPRLSLPNSSKPSSPC